MTDAAFALRRRIMQSFAARGVPPAQLTGEETALLAELADAHVVVLDPMGHVHMAHPFAGHRTGARVNAGEREWWGNCAWDGFGIVAALKLSDATVTSNGITVSASDPDPTVLFHVSLPARQWWDDVALACSQMLLFKNEDDIDAWCQAHDSERGGVITADVLVPMAARWYGDRLDPAWRPHELAERQSVLDEFGLTGPFWSLTGE
jgi:hypothetical protein